MALIWKIKACSTDNCSAINIFDTTGIYNSISNPGGWGSPNPDISTATDCVLQVMYPGAVLPVTIDIFASLPNITNTPYVLGPAGINMPNFPDGEYQFIVTVTVASVQYVANQTIFLTCGVACCVQNKLAEISRDRNCCQEKKEVQEALFDQTLLDGVIASSECGDFSNAQNSLNQLQKICAGGNCGCS